MNLPTPLPTDLRSLSLLQGQAVAEQLDQVSGDYVRAWNIAKTIFPALWAATAGAFNAPPQGESPQRIGSPPPPATAPIRPADLKNKVGRFNPATFRYESSFGSAVGNDMNAAGVRQTYIEAFSKHCKEHPEHGDNPIEAHRAVLAAHPELAKALRRQRKASAGEDAPPDDEDKDALGNSRSMALANSSETFTADDFAVAREAVAVATRMGRDARQNLTAMVFTNFGPRLAETILDNAR